MVSGPHPKSLLCTGMLTGGWGVTEVELVKRQTHFSGTPASRHSETGTHLRSRTWLATTPGWVDFPSGRSYRKSLQSQTTA